MSDAIKPDVVGEYAVVECLGHRVVAGRIQEAKRFGAEGVLIDVPQVDGMQPWQTFVAGGSLYAVTPCSAAAVEKYIRGNYQRPPHYMELPAPKAAPSDDIDQRIQSIAAREVALETQFLKGVIENLEALLLEPNAFIECSGRRLKLDPLSDAYVIFHNPDGEYQEIERLTDLQNALLRVNPSAPEPADIEDQDEDEDDDGGDDPLRDF